MPAFWGTAFPWRAPRASSSLRLPRSRSNCPAASPPSGLERRAWAAKRAPNRGHCASGLPRWNGAQVALDTHLHWCSAPPLRPHCRGQPSRLPVEPRSGRTLSLLLRGGAISLSLASKSVAGGVPKQPPSPARTLPRSGGAGPFSRSVHLRPRTLLVSHLVHHSRTCVRRQPP